MLDDPRLPERFWDKVSPEPMTGCWIWAAATSAGGYGTFTVHNRTVRAHRLAYERLVGPIPDGLQVDHLCRVRRCVNPNHLEPVTQRENLMRGEGSPAQNARKTHRKRGHLLAGDNLFIKPQGWRQCRICMRLWDRRAKAKRAEGRGE